MPRSSTPHDPLGSMPQVEWPQHLVPTKQIAEYLDASYWAALTIGGKPVGVVLMEPRLADATRLTMLDAVSRFAKLHGERKLPCLVGVEEIDGDGRWLVCDQAPAGHAGDVFALNWPLRQKLEFFSLVARGVQEIHRLGLVHGHLAPRNIWLDENLNPRLFAIGLASFSGVDLVDPALGYFTYLAPEVRTDPQSTSARSDVFTLGRLLLFLLTGQVPGEGDESILQVGLMGDVPTGLTRIVRKCAVRNPALRYQSVADLMVDLGQYERNPRVGMSADMDGARPTSASSRYPRVRPVGRRRRTQRP